MIRDLDLVKNFDNLYKKPVFLYGAGFYGEKILKILCEMDISVKGFVDSNQNVIGEKIQDIMIYSLEKLIEFSLNEDIVIILTTVKYREEMINILERNRVECECVYTIFGLFSSIYFNMNSKYLSKETKEKFREKLLIWKYNKKVETYFMQAYLEIINPLIEEKNPIIVYQPGKVGSKTLEATLKFYQTPVVRCHGILFSSEYDGVVGLKQNITNLLKTRNKIKMITLVRDPIAKDIGHFFQKISEEESDVGWYVKGIMEEDFQTSFLNYLSIVTPFDFTVNQNKKRFEKCMICHIDYIGYKSRKGAFWGWYEEEMKNNLGIDILQCNFDKENGYGILECGNVELLILKLEKINNLQNILGEFVGVNGLELVSTNQAMEKSYKYAYKQFCDEVRIPRRYIEFCYKENEYIEHFYNETERQEFYEKWMKKSIEI